MIVFFCLCFNCLSKCVYFGVSTCIVIVCVCLVCRNQCVFVLLCVWCVCPRFGIPIDDVGLCEYLWPCCLFFHSFIMCVSLFGYVLVDNVYCYMWLCLNMCV